MNNDLLNKFDHELDEAQRNGGLADCYAEPLRELFVFALHSIVDNTASNSAMVPCHSWECAGYNCWIIKGRYCQDKPCLVMAQHQ